jgi:hypothetical protein
LPVMALFNFSTIELLTKEVDRRLALELNSNVDQPIIDADICNNFASPSLATIKGMSEEQVLLSLVNLAQGTNER